MLMLIMEVVTTTRILQLIPPPRHEVQRSHPFAKKGTGSIKIVAPGPS
jgi:hypothetical protein